MHSGGFRKTPYESIYIELPEDQARQVFEQYFEVECDHVTCECCGADFSVYETDRISKGFGDEPTIILTKELFLSKCNPEHWPW